MVNGPTVSNERMVQVFNNWIDKIQKEMLMFYCMMLPEHLRGKNLGKLRNISFSGKSIGYGIPLMQSSNPSLHIVTVKAILLTEEWGRKVGITWPCVLRLNQRRAWQFMTVGNYLQHSPSGFSVGNSGFQLLGGETAKMTWVCRPMTEYRWEVDVRIIF
jgi:hypothetical protein